MAQFPAGEQSQQDQDIGSVVLFGGQSLRAVFTPTTADRLYVAGVILGRIAASSKLIPCVLAAGDGSEVPMGVTDLDIQSTGTDDIEIEFVSEGQVDRGKIFFDNADPVTDLVVDQLRHFSIVPRNRIALDKFDNS